MQATKTLLLLASCALCIGLAPSARADYVGLEVVERTDLTICQDPSPELPHKLDVCEVYAVFDDSADRVISVAFTDVSTTDPAGFFQHTLNPTNTAPSCAFVSLYPTLVCDSFVTLGVDCFDLIDNTTADPDFDFTKFNNDGEVSGGWYNSAPSNGQGDPDANGRVLVARFSYKQNKNTTGDVCLFTQLGGSRDIVEFLLEPFDCAVPGMQGGGGAGSGGSGPICYVDDDADPHDCLRPVPICTLPGTLGLHVAWVPPTSSMVQRSILGSGTLAATHGTVTVGLATVLYVRSLVGLAPAVVVGSPLGVVISTSRTVSLTRSSQGPPEPVNMALNSTS